MWWYALQSGQVYIKQYNGDAQLLRDELVGQEGVAFSTMWYQAIMVPSMLSITLHGWHTGTDYLFYPQCSRSAVAWVICPDNPNCKANCTEAVIENSAICDWFFYYRIIEFIKAFYDRVLGVTDYWIMVALMSMLSLGCQMWSSFFFHQIMSLMKWRTGSSDMLTIFYLLSIQ